MPIKIVALTQATRKPKPVPESEVLQIVELDQEGEIQELVYVARDVRLPSKWERFKAWLKERTRVRL